MNSRPKSEDPINLIHPGQAVIPVNGFQWVRGRYGDSGKLADESSFLKSIPGPVRVTPFAPDAYLAFGGLDGSDLSIIEFANKHGALGLGRVHFHYWRPDEDGVLAAKGEPIWSWRFEIAEFRRWFQIWCLTKEGNAHQLARFLNADDYFSEYPERAQNGQRLLISLTARVVERANEKIQPETYQPPGGCFLDECNRNPDRYDGATYLLGGVRYMLEYDRKKPTLPAKSQIRSERLLSAIWLQFAQLISGERTTRRCEICKELMDITETARKGSKRVHGRCSKNTRMQRWREGIKKEEA